jgi:hypothetical protein
LHRLRFIVSAAGIHVANADGFTGDIDDLRLSKEATASQQDGQKRNPVFQRIATDSFHGDTVAFKGLSRAFTDLASRGVDLSATSIVAPQRTEAPTLDQQKGMLHVKGYFPGQPVQINFEVLYQAVGGQWRLFGLSVQPVTPP